MLFMCAGVVLIAYLFIIWERVDRALPALLGAFVLLMAGLVPYEEALDYVELDVLFLLIGMMLVVFILAETGVFEWVAISIAQKASGVGWKILLGLLCATAFLSAFLDNVTTIILITPITLLICEILGYKAAPFIILEVMFANIGGASTLIGDPPNILIGHAGGLGFMEFIWHLVPVVFAVGLLCMLLSLAVFKNQFTGTAESRNKIKEAEPRLAIVDPVGLKRALPIFALVLVGFVLCHPLGIGPGSVALAGGAIMVILTGKNFEHVLRAVEWNTIIFLGSLFILVGALNHYGVFTDLSVAIFGKIRENPKLSAVVLLWLSGIASALLGSIPITMAFIPLVHSLIAPLAELHQTDEKTIGEPLWWALALGACLGGNGTMLGAPVNIVAMQIARKNKVPITFWEFLKYGLPFTLIGLVVSSAYLWWRYY